MDAALSIAAPATTACPTAAPLLNEADGAGDFMAALTRSLAESEAGSAAGVSVAPAAMTVPTVAGGPSPPTVVLNGAAAAPNVATTPSPADDAPPEDARPENAPPEAAQPDSKTRPPCVASLPPKAAPQGVPGPTRVEPATESVDGARAEQPATTDPAASSADPAPAPRSRPSTERAAPPSSPADEIQGEEVAPSLIQMATPPPAPLPAEAIAGEADVAGSAGTLPDRFMPPVPTLEPEAAAATASASSHPGRAEPRQVLSERPTPSADHSYPISLPLEMVPLHAAPRAGFVEAASPAAAPSPPSPARQLSSVVVALAFAPGGSDGFSLSLDPAELGRVEIHVQREGDSHSIRVTAERPETLALLQRDRQDLDRGLAEAGLRVDAGGIDFALGTPGDGGFEREPGGGQHRHAAATPRMAAPARDASPQRPPRGLLDLHI